MKTHQDSLGRAVRNAVLTSIVMVGGIAAGYGLGTFAIDAGLVPGTVVVADAGSPEAVDPRIDAVEQLIATHDCWTGSTDRPADLDRKLPGHVVVTQLPTPGAPAPRPTYSAALVGPALDQVFGVESTPGLVVYAFCR